MALPHQSILAALRSPSSRSCRYPHTVVKSPMGTDTKKMSRQLIGARTPPSTRPMNEPLKRGPARSTPSAIPRWLTFWKGVGEDGRRVGHQHRGTDALEHPHDDQPDPSRMALTSRSRSIGARTT